MNTKQEIIEKILKDNQNENGRVQTVKTDRLKELTGNETQEKFSEHIDIPHSTYTKLEQQERGVSLENALRISKYSNASLDYIFGIDDKINTETNDIHIALNNIFNIEIEKREYLKTDGTKISAKFNFEFPKLTINEKLYNLLKDYGNIKNQKLTENTFDNAVKDILIEYNKNTEETRNVDYVLIPVEMLRKNGEHIIDIKRFTDNYMSEINKISQDKEKN